MTPVEEKEIRGFSFKTVITIIGSTATIIISVMATYYGIREQIGKISTAMQVEQKMNEARMKGLEMRMDALQIQIDEMKREKTNP